MGFASYLEEGCPTEAELSAGSGKASVAGGAEEVPELEGGQSEMEKVLKDLEDNAPKPVVDPSIEIEKVRETEAERSVKEFNAWTAEERAKELALIKKNNAAAKSRIAASAKSGAKSGGGRRTSSQCNELVRQIAHYRSILPAYRSQGLGGVIEEGIAVNRREYNAHCQ